MGRHKHKHALEQVSLMRYETMQAQMDRRFAASERAVELLAESMETRFRYSDKAVELASEALTIRLNHLNEFREQMKDERHEFAKREQVDGIKETLDVARGRDSIIQWLSSAIIAGLITLAISVIAK